MIDLLDIPYVRLDTRSISEAGQFAKSVLGLEHVRIEAGGAYFRSDNRDHTLVYFEGDPANHTVGFEVATPAQLDAAAAELEGMSMSAEVGGKDECEQRHVRDFVRFRDPTGNKIELVVGPHHSGRRYFPSRDAGITGPCGVVHDRCATGRAVLDQRLGCTRERPHR